MTALGNLLQLIGQYGYLVVFFGVMLESAGVPLPGETVLITAGVLAHRGVLDYGDALFFGILGAAVGDQIGYWVGRIGGRPFVLRWGKYVFITPERLGRAERFFERHGGKAVFLARFITGLRVFGALVAGISRMPWGKFALYNVLGGTAWATAALSLGYFLWASIGLVEHWVGRFSLLLVAALVLAVLLRWAYRKGMRTRRDENPKERPPDPD
jgi:membrane protein DedA with SNARE-associated domain